MGRRSPSGIPTRKAQSWVCRKLRMSSAKTLMYFQHVSISGIHRAGSMTCVLLFSACFAIDLVGFPFQGSAARPPPVKIGDRAMRSRTAHTRLRIVPSFIPLLISLSTKATQS
ncbi:Uncharacterised protein [Mycobacteroides abscessus subsp. abscessus]|nr:Uncharacterised protein [Mycobacteroides abscessus subsp. abscessus]